MFCALANAGINTEMITTSEIRITALIDEAYADQAMRAIHETFLE
jgi:aspartate kinase